VNYSMVETERWLTVKQVAEMIGKKEQSVYDYINKGAFPRARQPGGGKWLIPEGDVQAYLTGKPVTIIDNEKENKAELAKNELAKVISEVELATARAKQAEQEAKQAEQQTKAKLLENGWKSIDEGLIYIQEEKERLADERNKVESLLESTRNREAETDDKLHEINEKATQIVSEKRVEAKAIVAKAENEAKNIKDSAYETAGKIRLEATKEIENVKLLMPQLDKIDRIIVTDLETTFSEYYENDKNGEKEFIQWLKTNRVNFQHTFANLYQAIKEVKRICHTDH